MRIAASIFLLTGFIGLAWTIGQLLQNGAQLGIVIAAIVPVVLVVLGWQLWTARSGAREAGMATAAVLLVFCVTRLGILAFLGGASVNVLAETPLQPTLISLWSGVLLYCAAIVALAWTTNVRPNHALHTDAPSLSRPLQGKGRASLRRAGDRER